MVLAVSGSTDVKEHPAAKSLMLILHELDEYSDDMDESSANWVLHRLKQEGWAVENGGVGTEGEAAGG